MAWNTVEYRLTSSAPLIMHNGQTADPTNKFAKALKLISSKRAKTDADHLEMARIEFMAGLYMDETGPVIPVHVIEAMVFEGARKSKEGKVAQASVYSPNHATLEYDGPRTADALFEDANFRFARLVRVSTSKVLRTRPIFNEWALSISLQVEDGLVNPVRVYEWLAAAGVQIGLGDWRPQYGRFTVERL